MYVEMTRNTMENRRVAPAITMIVMSLNGNPFILKIKYVVSVFVYNCAIGISTVPIQKPNISHKTKFKKHTLKLYVSMNPWQWLSE